MHTSKVKLLFLALIAVLPSALMRVCYRWFFGYKVGKNVRIGFSVIDAKDCVIEDNVSVGHFNVFIGVKKLFVGEHAKIGHLNIIRGGDEVRLGRYTEIMRLNEINSIPNPVISTPAEPKFLLGDGSVVTTSHKIDFTDKVEFGKCVVLGGRNSSLWTHNRQATKPITIGDYSYVGSEIRIAPGGAIPPRCVVGIGSVITKKFEGEYQVIGGVPAKVIKPLDEEAKIMVEFKTRPDLPDDI